MPNWKTHIEIGKRLNKYLDYKNEDLNLFLFGSILPDINNSYVFSDVSKKIEHSITHFGKCNTPTFEKFFNEYKREINNKEPLFLGYFVHLYTDNKWNENFRFKIKNLNYDNKKSEELRKIKQSDFKLYSNQFIGTNILLNNNKNIIDECKKIKEISIKQDDIEKAINFLLKQEVYKENYKFYSYKELDELNNNTIKDLNIFIKKLH